ncbi:bifunctional diaminohydroxyphosphoribosylaminopyrimidine deaminase/5-amino-6-(5-phosphoribosylamino)uracil reductase RibD [Ferruginibacter sp. HRS2-29]|uniref:bifunctional diaminohydroxyphosphoribosylaminopyrimidine deaminase/5-amino-6-(5-phosphoribosylamino)uracil reductase RibD n=1 Tax=Ferruginibacter sp. HRS2-29 TaxID=2487334 RepID=UPI0020CC20CA
MDNDQLYMTRCFELARLGAGSVAPNPMVGAVLVHNGRIIGEGYHREYGQVHAEVNCINSVAEADKQFIPASVIYVSLEPCAHFGITPPCCDLIIRNQIPKVVIGCRDNFEKVNGEGIRRMREAGINVIVGVLENEALELNKRFFTFHEKKRPYIILKWAQTNDHIIARSDLSPVKISNPQTDILAHKWRSEESAILVGFNTAVHDDPSLTTRLYKGKNPVRIVIDEQLQLPVTLRLFDGTAPLIVINRIKEKNDGAASYAMMEDDEAIPQAICRILYQRRLNSLIVEGGAKTVQTFIDAGLWDEARIITNGLMEMGEGLPAPELGSQPAVANPLLINSQHISSDYIRIYRNRSLSSRK